MIFTSERERESVKEKNKQACGSCDVICMAKDPIHETRVIKWGYARKSETSVPSGKQCYYCRRTQRADARLQCLCLSVSVRGVTFVRVIECFAIP